MLATGGTGVPCRPVLFELKQHLQRGALPGQQVSRDVAVGIDGREQWAGSHSGGQRRTAKYLARAFGPLTNVRANRSDAVAGRLNGWPEPGGPPAPRSSLTARSLRGSRGPDNRRVVRAGSQRPHDLRRRIRDAGARCRRATVAVVVGHRQGGRLAVPRRRRGSSGGAHHGWMDLAVRRTGTCGRLGDCALSHQGARPVCRHRQRSRARALRVGCSVLPAETEHPNVLGAVARTLSGPHGAARTSGPQSGPVAVGPGAGPWGRRRPRSLRTPGPPAAVELRASRPAPARSPESAESRFRVRRSDRHRVQAPDEVAFRLVPRSGCSRARRQPQREERPGRARGRSFRL